MGKLARNTLENLAGTGWSIGLGLICVPWLIRAMGAEAFGLSGVLLGLQSVCAIVDLGIGATVSRELARGAGGGVPARAQRDLVYTLQAIYWSVAVAIGLLVFVSAPLIASQWLRPQQVPIETVDACLRWMAVAVAVQFPLVFYRCGMLGLHRNGAFNVVFALSALVRWPGSVVALWYVPAPETYFVVQVVAGTIATAAAAVLLWRCLPPAEGTATFRRDEVARLWRFSASYSINSTAILALQQVDKVVLSTLLPLDLFGYYSLAQRLASGFYSVIVSVNGATFPHFSAAVASGDRSALARVYHRGCQVMALCTVPIAAVSIVCARDVMRVWTGDPLASTHAAAVLAILMAGMLLHAIAQGPYYLQVAHGSWRIISRTNLVLVVTMIPLTVVLARAFGGPGAAAVSVLVNLGALLTVPLVHRTFLGSEPRRWWLDAVVAPCVAAFGLALAARMIAPADVPVHWTAVGLVALVLVTAAALAWAAPEIRRTVGALVPGIAPGVDRP